MGERNQFVVRGHALDNWQTETYGQYQTRYLLLETDENYKQVLKIYFYSRQENTINFEQEIKGYPCIVKGYINGRQYTSKKGVEDVFIKLVGYDFDIVYNEEPKSNTKPIKDVSEPTIKTPIAESRNTDTIDVAEDDLPF